MNGTDLTKPEKKIARQVIEKGLQKEYVDGIIMLDNIITKWKANVHSNRDAWVELYKTLTAHDKHISRRYDHMSGSRYLYIIACQLADGIIDRNDLKEFREDIREKISILSGLENL